MRNCELFSNDLNHQLIKYFKTAKIHLNNFERVSKHFLVADNRIQSWLIQAEKEFVKGYSVAHRVCRKAWEQAWSLCLQPGMVTKIMQQNWSSGDPSAFTLGTDATPGNANITDVGVE